MQAKDLWRRPLPLDKARSVCYNAHMNKTQEFRVTVRTNYTPGCPGHTDPRARQGHYFRANNVVEAAAAAWKEIHRNQPWVKGPDALDIQYWGNHPKRGQIVS